MSRIARFGLFEADLLGNELRKQGRAVRLQQQPFELLRCLLEQPGEIVTRGVLRERLWPVDVTVDFDQSLNKCVAKLRDALGDSATSPRFVETLPKRGYRFIAPVTVSAPVHEPVATPPPQSEPLPPPPDTPNPSMSLRVLVPLGIMAGLAGVVLSYTGCVQP